MAVRADSGWARIECSVYGGVGGQGGVRVWGRRYPSVVDGDVGAGADPAGTFGRFAGDGYERVYTQEKKGFAEAKLKKDGQDLAVMAISDIRNTPTAASKFQNSTTQIGGFPAVKQGSTGTAVLVADRYQVKVLSRNPSFTASDRQVWLEKFDLQGLAKLKS